MTPDQIRRVRASFAQLLPNARGAAALFYANLFEADPSLRPMFKGPVDEQGAKLMQALGAAVGLLDKPEVLLPVLRQMGIRHGGYGVQPAHYGIVGAALLQTLAQGLGETFDTETRAAWAALYGLVADTMIEASSAAGGTAGGAAGSTNPRLAA